MRYAFRQRQIILRSDDRVSAIVLSSRLQQWAAGIAAALALWLVASSAGMVWQSEQLAQQSAVLDQARGTQAKLIDRVEAAQRHAQQLLARLETAGAVDAADADGTELGNTIAKLQDGLAAISERNDDLAERAAEAKQALAQADARAIALAGRVERLESSLAQARDRLSAARTDEDELSGRLAGLRADLRSARLTAQATAHEREVAKRRAAELADRLQAAKARAASLDAQVAGLESRLADSESARSELMDERRALAAELTRLEETLGHRSADAAATALDQRVAALKSAVVSARQRGERLAGDRAQLRDRVTQLENTIAAMRERHKLVLARFSARTQSGLDAVEKTVAMTGLDVDALVARVVASAKGQGGPFIPSEPRLVDGPFADKAGQLEQQMRRLAALQAALGSLPLNPPLDAYWISSGFGKRKDPVNGRWAMHEGLDLSAQRGAPVHAGAPGVVTYAGGMGNYGRMVEIDHGFGIKTRYAHLKSIAVKKGQRVEHRQRIGRVGSSGRSTGPHTHYEIRVEGEPVDPINFLKAGRYVFKG